MDADETVESITGETPEKVCPDCEELMSRCTCSEDDPDYCEECDESPCVCEDDEDEDSDEEDGDEDEDE